MHDDERAPRVELPSRGAAVPNNDKKEPRRSTRRRSTRTRASSSTTPSRPPPTACCDWRSDGRESCTTLQDVYTISLRVHRPQSNFFKGHVFSRTPQCVSFRTERSVLRTAPFESLTWVGVELRSDFVVRIVGVRLLAQRRGDPGREPPMRATSPRGALFRTTNAGPGKTLRVVVLGTTRPRGVWTRPNARQWIASLPRLRLPEPKVGRTATSRPTRVGGQQK